MRTVVAVGLLLTLSTTLFAAAPSPPQQVVLRDREWDNGNSIDVLITLPQLPVEELETLRVVVQRSGEYGGLYTDEQARSPSRWEIQSGVMTERVERCIRGEAYWFRVACENAEGERSEFVAPEESVVAERSLLDGGRWGIAVLGGLVCISVAIFIMLARAGWPLTIRPIAGLEAVEEAVGRATEMGKMCLFIPGIQDMNEMQTISGLTILAHVSERAAEYDCQLEVPTARSLVMTAARETVEAAYLLAGRPDAYHEDSIYYVTDEQFAYVSYLTGLMVREKPAACFYLGSFYAESLILAETGNAIGAIQVAGTAQPAQLPFFVAACDYTLIGEEFFAASAYLAKDPDQLGSLKGQDMGKLIVAALVLVGVGLSTLAQLDPLGDFAWWSEGLRDVFLHGGG
ncbi:MAG: hypothetical protein KDA90_13670 [Planctomycetaceae bacterium]|nr:hypothetical protein [Planctomycetaceae bacterium]